MKPVRDQRRLAFVRSLPCSVSDCGHTHIEAAHTTARGLRGMSQKADDLSAIPLCTAHHREYHALGERLFEQRYDLDIRQVVNALNVRPVIRIQGGAFVGYVEGREYLLGRVEIGLRQAIRHIIQFRREELREYRYAA